MPRRKRPTDPFSSSAKERRSYEVSDAYHTLRRAHEIVGDKKLMGEVKKHAGAMASEHHAMAHHIGQLAKTGKLSPKQFTKLTKLRPIA